MAMEGDYTHQMETVLVLVPMMGHQMVKALVVMKLDQMETILMWEVPIVEALVIMEED